MSIESENLSDQIIHIPGKGDVLFNEAVTIIKNGDLFSGNYAKKTIENLCDVALFIINQNIVTMKSSFNIIENKEILINQFQKENKEFQKENVKVRRENRILQNKIKMQKEMAIFTFLIGVVFSSIVFTIFYCGNS